ncbi:MAG: ATP-binding cassette domain-containing protein [Anaerolineae bacterium]|nr:ATP-binding cassette domain-containing protein [Anaerolineae bacterium]
MSATSLATARNPLVSIEGLTYTFEGGKHPALADLSLTIAPGDFVVITGPSGCGKSTLALAIGGYLFQQYQGAVQGTVRVADKDAQRAPIYEMAELVGLVQQNPEAQLCTLTVEDEVAFGLENHRVPPAEIGTRIDRALVMVNATHLRHRDLRTLSGGEKQRVAIAAVLALEPQVLILDEPTSSLDPTATAAVFDVIETIRASAGTTVIVIEHKLAYLMPFQPRVIRMSQGQIVSDRTEYWADLGTDGIRDLTPSRTPEQRGPAPVVEIQHLDIGIDGRSALADITLTLWPGEFAVAMGDNGSGKSTLLWSMLGLRKPTRGCVTVLGKNTAETPVSTLAQRVGFIFQNPDHQLFANTVWDEATIALRNLGRMDDGAADHVRQLLAQAGLGDRHGDHPYRLSYGEKRRLNLISILGYQPDLLLLDEILIGQDAENIRYLLRMLQTEVNRGATVVMVNHHPEIVQQVATRLIFLETGQLRIDAAIDEAMQQLAQSGRTAYLPQQHKVKGRQPDILTATPRAAPACWVDIGRTSQAGVPPRAPRLPEGTG